MEVQCRPGQMEKTIKKTSGISIIESLVCLVIIGIGFIAINQMIAFSISSMDRSMERTKVNFLSESAVEDIVGDPNNASSYEFTQSCNSTSHDKSSLAGSKKDKWSNLFKEERISLDNKTRKISCVSNKDEKKVEVKNSKKSGGIQALLNFKTKNGNRNKSIGVVVK